MRKITTPEGISISYVEITPEKAELLLQSNTHNRNHRDRLVVQYARDLDGGDWPFTGDAVRIADDGTVLDGQHRLMAIVLTEISMPTLLIEGLPRSVQRYIDGGAKRSAGDQLHLEGVPNATIVASISRMVLRWEAWRAELGDIYVSNAEIINHSLANLDTLTRAGLTAHSIAAHIPGCSRQALGTAYYRAVEVTGNPFKVADFFTRLDTGENLTLGDPVFALRNSLIRQDFDTLAQMWMTVRAWNAEQKGEALGRNIYLPRTGISSKRFPDMFVAPDEELEELDEETAEALQQLREKV